MLSEYIHDASKSSILGASIRCFLEQEMTNERIRKYVGKLDHSKKSLGEMAYGLLFFIGVLKCAGKSISQFLFNSENQSSTPFPNIPPPIFPKIPYLLPTNHPSFIQSYLSSFLMNSLHCVLFAFLIVLLSACQSGADAPAEASDMAFVHVNVLPMDSETILQDQTVLIKDGKILQMGASTDVKVPSGTTTIDGTNQYLMPGLSEMHAHIPSPTPEGDTMARMAAPLFLYLANGITIIRGMLGHPYHLELRELVMNDVIPGPRIYTSGTSINGNSAPDPETAEKLVRENKATGFDFLKLHPGLTTETFDAVVATAQEVDIPYAGHVSNLVGIRHALANQYESIDHIDGYLEGLVPLEQDVDPTTNGFFGFNFVDLADPEGIEALAQTTVENGIAIVPTQSVVVRWTNAVSPENMASEPEMKYVHPRLLQNWQERKHGFHGLETYSAERTKKFELIRAQIIKALHDAGALMLLGSDSPQVFNVPGFSIHHELTYLEEAGLSRFEALQTGTVNPAKYFGEEGTYGVVAKDASADLILLKANPLDDLANLHQRTGVMYRGHWLPESEIQAGLKDLEEYYAGLKE